MPVLDSQTAQSWIERWDRQQEQELPEREERFTAMIDAIAEGAGRPDPLVLDIGCGPGSLGVRLLDRMPQATVIGIDTDPVTLALAAAAHAGRAGLRFADLDLRDPGWGSRLELPRRPDAAVSTTALHWLTAPALQAVYAELAGLLKPGGLLLNGDHMMSDSPALDHLGWALLHAEDRRRFPDGHGEGWTAWWQAAAADENLAEAVARRTEMQLGADHHNSPSQLLATHVDALRAAGFAEVGTLWQRGADRLLCAVRL